MSIVLKTDLAEIQRAAAIVSGPLMAGYHDCLAAHAWDEALIWAYTFLPNEVDEINERAAANLARMLGEGNG